VDGGVGVVEGEVLVLGGGSALGAPEPPATPACGSTTCG
jgi:hypothetical protein